MRFYFEKLQDTVRHHTSILKRAKRTLADHNLTRSVPAYDVGVFLEDTYKESHQASVTQTGEYSVVLAINPLTPEEFDELTAEIDSILSDYGYTLDEDYKQESWQIGHCFSHKHHSPWLENIPSILTVQLCSNTCKTINTGKLVPETKNICNLISTGA